MKTVNLEIPKIDDPNPIKLTLKNGDQLFIVGPNGSGKSALMQRFALQDTNKFKWITAHRQTWFDSAKNNLTLDERQRSESQRLRSTSDPNARWWDLYKGRDWSTTLYDLDAKENAIDKAIAQHVRNQDTSEAIKIAAESPLPFDQMNELLAMGKLTVTLERAEDQSILASYPQGQLFSIVEMSDGERSAMMIAGYVITAKSGTVFLIDEPEKHLHRAIIQPFLSALFDLRKHDCAFIVATHEMALPVANSDARTLMLRSCQWENNQCAAWDTVLLKPNSQLPEELILQKS